MGRDGVCWQLGEFFPGACGIDLMAEAARYGWGLHHRSDITVARNRLLIQCVGGEISLSHISVSNTCAAGPILPFPT